MRLAFRCLAQSPGFTSVAVLTLGASLAVGMVVLAFYEATVLWPLRVPHADQLVQIWSANRDHTAARPLVSWPLYQRLANDSPVFHDAAAAFPTGFTVRDGSAPLSVGGVRITGNLPSVLGVEPLLGRSFSAEEERAGGPAVAMVSASFWKTHLGQRSDVIGTTLGLDGIPHEIVGVLPAVLSQLFAGDAVYVPRPFELPNAPRDVVERGAVPYQVIARLKPGVSLAAADQALVTLTANYRTDLPGNVDVERIPSSRTLVDQLAGASRPVVTALLGVAACSLFIACGSIATIFLLRLLSRARDYAVRISLGATRRQVVAGPVSEAILLTAGGLAGGLALAALTLPLVNRFTTPFLPRLPAAELTAPTVGLALLAAMLVAAGLIALALGFARGVRVGDALRSRARATPGTSRMHRLLVAGQIAATLTLVSGAIVLGANIRRLTAIDPGFSPDGLATAFVNLPRARYGEANTRLQFYRTALAELRQAPGVTDAAVVSIAPLARALAPGTFGVVGRPADPAQQPSAIVRVISDDYFTTLQLALVAGRLPEERDARPVAAISASLARQLFAEGSAVGQTLLLGPNGGTPTEIVGVVADLRANGLALETTDEIYVPLAPGNAGAQMAFVVRTNGAPESLHATLRAAVARVDAQQSVAVFQTYSSLVATSIWPQRIAAGVAGAFAASATLFALLGVFGLVSLWVSQRTHEWGLRAALGATPMVLVVHVLRSASGVIVYGVVIGLALAAGTNHLLRSLLIGIDPTDPFLLGASALVFVVAAFLASAWPAARASRIDPNQALRAD